MGRSEPERTEGPPAAVQRRSYVTLPLAQLVPGVTRAAFRKRSPAGATLMADWVAIVGPVLAMQTEPRRLTRGTLTIACAGPVALELQHLQGALIGRINAAVGQGTVSALRFVQDAALLPSRPKAATADLPPPPLPAPVLEGIAEGPLRDSLAYLFQALCRHAPGRKQEAAAPDPAGIETAGHERSPGRSRLRARQP